MNIDIFSLLIRKLDPEDTKTFGALRLTCKSSWKACVNHSRRLLKQYNEREIYVYWERVEDFGFQYEITVSDKKLDREYGHILFITTQENIQN
jgi:hypothetical protein